MRLSEIRNDVEGAARNLKEALENIFNELWEAHLASSMSVNIDHISDDAVLTTSWYLVDEPEVVTPILRTLLRRAGRKDPGLVGYMLTSLGGSDILEDEDKLWAPASIPLQGQDLAAFSKEIRR